MSKLILPRTTTAARQARIPSAGEILYDTDALAFFGGDGVTAGGVRFGNTQVYDAYVYGLDYDADVTTHLAADASKKVVLNQEHDAPGDALRYQAVTDFSQMPAHNFRRCVMDDLSTRHVAYYLNASDSRKKANGEAANLTGTDGDVMVEIPVVHYRIDRYTDSNSHNHIVWLVSNKAFAGSAVHRFFYTGPGGATARPQYVGAFRDVLCDSTGAAKTQEDDSTPAAYESGDMFRSIAGARPAGNIIQAVFRTGSGVNGGTNVNGMFGQFLMMMMAIDGGTLDTQAGISGGFSRITSFDYGYLRKTGRTAIFGNGTGTVYADDEGADADLAEAWVSGVTEKVVQFSYRGIEDPFGSQQCFEDGVRVHQNATASDYTQSGFWCTNDTNLYTSFDGIMGYGSYGAKFPAAGFTGNSAVWVSNPFPKVDYQFVKDFDAVTFFPTSAESGAGLYYLCDRYYGFTGAAESGTTVVVGVEARGGLMADAYDGYANGMAHVNIRQAPSAASAQIGCRIAC